MIDVEQYTSSYYRRCRVATDDATYEMVRSTRGQILTQTFVYCDKKTYVATDLLSWVFDSVLRELTEDADER